MQVLTIKAKPKTIFGIILALTGIVVIILTFTFNHPEKTVSASKNVKCSTADERRDFLASLGFETDVIEEQKDIIIPKEFNEVYTKYNEVKKQQGFDLERYKGKTASLYTYNISNYKGNDNVIANLIVCDGVLIRADLCDPSAKDGFLTGLEKNENAAT